MRATITNKQAQQRQTTTTTTTTTTAMQVAVSSVMLWVTNSNIQTEGDHRFVGQLVRLLSGLLNWSWFGAQRDIVSIRTHQHCVLCPPVRDLVTALNQLNITNQPLNNPPTDKTFSLQRIGTKHTCEASDVDACEILCFVPSPDSKKKRQPRSFQADDEEYQ